MYGNATAQKCQNNGFLRDEHFEAVANIEVTETHNTDIFTAPNMKGQLGVNAMVSPKHLYDYLIFDSKASEQKFAEELEAASEVILYVKLPRGFYINTPVGKYNPDWVIAFDSEKVKHVYFVAENKGDLSTLQLREIESAKIKYARKHFAAAASPLSSTPFFGKKKSAFQHSVLSKNGGGRW